MTHATFERPAWEVADVRKSLVRGRGADNAPSALLIRSQKQATADVRRAKITTSPTAELFSSIGECTTAERFSSTYSRVPEKVTNRRPVVNTSRHFGSRLRCSIGMLPAPLRRPKTCKNPAFFQTIAWMSSADPR
jgi:hypothetical protein